MSMFEKFEIFAASKRLSAKLSKDTNILKVQF